MRRRRERWKRLASGLYVPPLLRFAPGYPCCERGCQFCSGSTPEEFQVVISNMANQNCEHCADYDGTYVLPLNPEVLPLNCNWIYWFPGEDPCGATGSHIGLGLYDAGGGEAYFQGGLIHGDSSPFYSVWQDTENWELPVDCRAVTDHELPLAGDYSQICDSSAATFIITAL